MTIKKKKIIVDPTLKDLLDVAKEDVMLDTNCHAIGTIQAFDSATQTATVTINYKKTIFEWDKKTSSYKNVLLSYPILAEVPVVILGGGAAQITFPITKGDECLVLFNDRDFSNWYAGNNNGPVASSRLHSFTDAIVLVGIRSSASKLGDYDATRARLRNGSTQVAVSSSKVKINNSTRNLNTILQDLIAQIKSMVISVSAVSPTGGTVSATSSTALDLIATQIGELLE